MAEEPARPEIVISDYQQFQADINSPAGTTNWQSAFFKNAETLWRLMDKNGDGVLSKKELEAQISKPQDASLENKAKAFRNLGGVNGALKELLIDAGHNVPLSIIIDTEGKPGRNNESYGITKAGFDEIIKGQLLKTLDKNNMPNESRSPTTGFVVDKKIDAAHDATTLKSDELRINPILAENLVNSATMKIVFASMAAGQRPPTQIIKDAQTALVKAELSEKGQKTWPSLADINAIMQPLNASLTQLENGPKALSPKPLVPPPPLNHIPSAPPEATPKKHQNNSAQTTPVGPLELQKLQAQNKAKPGRENC